MKKGFIFLTVFFLVFVFFLSQEAEKKTHVSVVTQKKAKLTNNGGLPFGSFDSPTQGSTVSGSVPVTGWALDDTEVDNISLFWQEVNSTTVNYLGFATSVEGQRPDVAEAFPEYPNNTQAGWGYMMLTNFLPNQGNGTFTLHATVTDNEGNSVQLGSTTIHCDNANRVQPFGAIDTPAQGETLLIPALANHGWVLTPLPKFIPTDGSTIDVWVDSVNLGHPSYNIYRSDLAALFPEYENSDGAGGLFNIDVTTYQNGVHTIFWTAQDNEGYSDGIGSRYFSINNPRIGGTKQTQKIKTNKMMPDFSLIRKLPKDFSSPITIKRGFHQDEVPMCVLPDETGITRIVTRELERVVIQLNDIPISYSGWQIVGEKVTHLPIGSTLDSENGIFHWIPAHGFRGRFHLVFAEAGPNGPVNRKDIYIEVVPKTTR